MKFYFTGIIQQRIRLEPLKLQRPEIFYNKRKQVGSEKVVLYCALGANI